METSKDPIQFSSTALRPRIKQVLEVFVGEGGHGSLTEDMCKTLLQEAPPSADYDIELDEIEPASFEGGLGILSGYPECPLYHRLSDAVAYWIITGNCPVFDLPNMFMLDEDSTMSERNDTKFGYPRKHNLEASGSPLSGSHSLWECWSEDERMHTIAMVLKSLGLRGVLDLLGVRCTVGSHNILPPPKEILLESFTRPHHPSAKLSVGGRALSKHSHRDDTRQWWGICTGSEEAKNKHALKICRRIMRDATWINIHTLPQELKVIEMRTIEGYGVRWLHDGSEFRGFLEPQMEDGHSLGWRH